MEGPEPRANQQYHGRGESQHTYLYCSNSFFYCYITQAWGAFPFLKHHVNTWPVTDIIHHYLSNHRKYMNTKQKGAVAGENDVQGGAELNILPDTVIGGGDFDSVVLSD